MFKNIFLCPLSFGCTVQLTQIPHHILKQFPTTCKTTSFLDESYLEVQEGNEKVFNLTQYLIIFDQISNNFLNLFEGCLS